MKFALLNDQDTLYFYSLSEQENAILPIQAMDGARYIFTEQEGAEVAASLLPKRVDNDLHLRLRSESQTPSAIVLKDFYQTQGGIYGLSDSGEYRLHLSADSAVAQGPVTWASESLGVQQDQAEAPFLVAIQRAATLQAVEQQLEAMNAANPAAEAAQAQQAEAAAQAAPMQLMDAANPAITAIYDNVGSRTGAIELDFQNGISIIDDKQPTFEGTGEPGSMLQILQNGNVIASVEVDAQGNWFFQPQVPLADGTHFFTVRDSAIPEQSSQAVAMIIDTVAPARAKIVDAIQDHTGTAISLTSGSHTGDNSPTLSGKADSSTLITIYNGNTPLASIFTNPQGNWSFTWTTPPLPDGEYAFRVTSQDASGNTSLPSNTFKVTIDTVPPSQPEILEVLDDVGTTTGPLLNGAVTDDDTPTFIGRAEAGTIVTIYDNEQKIGEVVADANGNWTFTPAEPLDDGEHSFKFTATDKAGNESVPSASWDLTLNTNLPDAPTIGSVYDDVGAVTGELASGDTTDDTQPTLSGQAEAGAIVSIYDNGEKIGEVEADTNGNWIFTPEEELAEGEHSFTAIAQNPAGNVSEPSQPWDVVIDITAPEKPVIGGEGPGISEAIDDHGPIQGSIEQGGVTDDDTPTFNGTGEPGDTVIIRDGEEEIGRVEIDEDGNWSFTPEEPLDEGDHSINVIIQDKAGNQSDPSDPWVVIVDTTEPDAPTIGSVYDDVGAITGELASGDHTDDTQPTLSGQAEAGAIVSIYDNGEKIGEVVADAEGNWTFTPEEELAEGEHSFTAVAQDAAGNLSEPSQPWEVVIDTTRPDKPGTDGEGPGIGEAIDDEGVIQGPIEKGGVTDDDTPTFNGTGEPGDTVIIRDGEEEIGRVEIDEDGNWSFTPEEPLDEGEHEITVIIEDKAGNQSDPSDPWVVIVDTTAPDAPTIGSVYDDVGAITGELASGDHTDDTQPTLSGQAEAGAIVSIYDNGEKIGEVVADAEGNWTFTPEEELAEGEHSFTSRAQDAAGNLSEPSQPWEVVIDTTRPDKPGTEGEGSGIGEAIDDHGPIQGPIEKGGVTDDNTPTFNGTGEPGDTVIVRDGEEEIGRVEVDEDGNWSFTPEEPLADGGHSINVIIQDKAGNQSEPSDSWVLTVDTTAPDAPTIGSVYDDVGEVTGELASGDVTDDQQPTLSGQAEAGAIVSIYDNGEKIGEVEADANGNWTFTPEEELAEGEHSFTTQAQDAAGNLSEPSQPWEVVIDVAPAEPPVIEAVIDDVGPQTGELRSGDVTDDSRPQISGSSTPGLTVIVYDRGVEIGRVQADEQGKWSFTPENELADGEYSFTAVTENAAGNRSEASDAFELIVYTGNGPTQVARLSHMGKDSGQDGHDFVTDNGSFGRLMHGVLSAELVAGQTLQVSTDGGTTWLDALIDGTNWAAQDRSAHTGNWNIQTRVVDQSGNAGYVMEQAVTLDTIRPTRPSSIHLDGTELLVEFAPAGVAVGDRIAIIADGGAQRFEYVLTQEDIDAGSVRLKVGSVDSASAALVDKAGNLSDFASTGSAPGVNSVVTGDVAEVYGQNADNVFSIEDVSVLNQIKVIEGNGGVDTLKLLGSDQVLDLSAVQGRLSSIEVIDITGSGDNVLKVSLGDVLELGQHRAFHGENTVQLAIKGDAGDVVMLSDLLPNGMDVGDWEHLGDLISAGISYEVYHHAALQADILVQQGVAVEFH